MLDDRDKRSSLTSKDECITERIHGTFIFDLVCVFIECEWALASSNHSRLVGSVEPLFASRESNAVNYKAKKANEI
eukprot:scaffold25470_cov78-Skeletonema_dohrnii-CCMP3373.AAC.1